MLAKTSVHSRNWIESRAILIVKTWGCETLRAAAVPVTLHTAPPSPDRPADASHAAHRRRRRRPGHCRAGPAALKPVRGRAQRAGAPRPTSVRVLYSLLTDCRRFG
eukprot:SAG22_NODE_9301_length_597_cov_3.403614_2_plen_105_part_01